MKTIKSIGGCTFEEEPDVQVAKPVRVGISTSGTQITFSADGIILTSGKSKIKIPRQRLQELAVLADPDFGK